MFAIKASRKSVEISGAGPVKHLLMLYSQVTQSVARAVKGFGVSEDQAQKLVLTAAKVAFVPGAVRLRSTEEE